MDGEIDSNGNKDLVIFGGGEFAQIALEYFTYDSNFEVRAFAVDPEWMPRARAELETELPILAVDEVVGMFDPVNTSAFVAIPATKLNTDRSSMTSRVKKLGFPLATYVSSAAFVWRNAIIGENCFIFENNVIQPFVTIGDGVIMWSGNHIGHRTEVDDFAFITSHVVVSGYCKIGTHSFLGVNATVNDEIVIAPNCVIGAGAHVNRSTEEGFIYVGSPARAVPGRSSKDVSL